MLLGRSSLELLEALLGLVPRLHFRLAEEDKQRVADKVNSGGDEEHDPPLTDTSLEDKTAKTFALN